MPHAGEPVPAFILFPCKTAGLHHSEVTLKGKKHSTTPIKQNYFNLFYISVLYD